jgi:DNA mismatch repair protein MutS
MTAQAKKSAADTPMMRQYLELKASVPDAILLYRMGDFYELFFQDAVEAAELLELTLTSRNKDDPDSIPMAGVPYHALQGYLKRLVQLGKKVAIAEQKVNPDNPKMMDRELVRVVTPGMPMDDEGLEARESCWLAGVCQVAGGLVGMAFLDFSTGEFRLTEVADVDGAVAELERMEPAELVVPEELAEHEALKYLLARTSHTTPDRAWFDLDAGRRAVCQLLKTRDLAGFGANELTAAVGAAGAVVSYARDTARVGLEHINAVRPYIVSGHMVFDEATRRNLEILRPMRGSGRKGTLLWLLDRTCTAMGGRRMREWLSRPLVDVPAIQARQDAIEALWDGRLRRGIRDNLKQVSDLERLAGRVAQGTANARDLVALSASLAALPAVFAPLRGIQAFTGHLPTDLVQEVQKDIQTWLQEDPPTAITDGGIIRPSAHKPLKELISLSRDGKSSMASMEAREKEKTGINSLKVKHNRVFGYFLEVTSSNLHKVPDTWIRKQTLANAERYITPELKEFEEKVLGADERRKAMEYDLFIALRERVAASVPRLQALALAVSFLDAIAALADLAVENRYVRPVVHAGDDLEIIEGRHPVVESMSMEERFVPNDLHMDGSRRLIILTGPNMAGKSTVMRQVALIALMAQIGSFVPAKRARIGVCDRIFVRVGASDDLARGRSTFMVEMSETALILNQATSRSLVLLDEIGRGTSTYDGLAIAWAVAEAVHDRLRARTIFATHYHELTALGDTRPRAANLHIAVSEWGNQIIFLRSLREGGASKSYGIQCARLAGMPDGVVKRARALLEELESAPPEKRSIRQLDLFGLDNTTAPAEPEPVEEPQEPEEPDPLRDLLIELNPDEVTPRQALDILYRLREMMVREAVELG